MKGLKHILTALFLGANLCALGLLWACCLSTWVPPERFAAASLAGLAFPALLLVNIGFVVFWLIFKARLALVPLIGIGLTGSYVMDYCPLRATKQEPQDALCLISYNVAGPVGEESLEALSRYVACMSPDILCIQEGYTPKWDSRPDARRLIDSLGYHKIRSHQFVLLTRLRVISDTLRLASPALNHVNTMAVWLEHEGDSLLLISNHLESNKLNDKDKDAYRELIKDPHRQTVAEDGRHLASKLSQAARLRGQQTDALCQLVDSLRGHSIILCGDFNDTPISYTYQQLARRLRSAFRESGRGLGRSFNQRGFPVRIDHIFTSDDWQSFHTYADTQTDLSDHYPIVTHLRKKTENPPEK